MKTGIINAADLPKTYDKVVLRNRENQPMLEDIKQVGNYVHTQYPLLETEEGLRYVSPCFIVWLTDDTKVCVTWRSPAIDAPGVKWVEIADKRRRRL